MDPQIEELKELVRQSITLSQENNKILHAMRRNSRIKTILWFAFILVSTGTFTWLFLTYALPYLLQLADLYNSAQATLHSFQNTGPGH